MSITTPWTTVVPSLGPGTIGDGTVLARYRRSDGALKVQGQLLWGASTAAVYYIDIEVEPLPYPIMLWGAPTDLLVMSCYGALSDSANSANDNEVAAGVVRVHLTTNESGQPCSTLRLLPIFGTKAISATHPFTWTAGSLLTFGNALEAFDN